MSVQAYRFGNFTRTTRFTRRTLASTRRAYLRNALECDACLLFFDQMDAEMKTNLLAAYVSAGMPEKVLAFVSQVRRFVRVDLTRISPVEAVGEQSDV